MKSFPLICNLWRVYRVSTARIRFFGGSACVQRAHLRNVVWARCSRREASLAEIRPAAQSCTYLLPGKDGEYVIHRDKAPNEPITFSTFDNMWRRVQNTIDLHGATSHVFRHTLGTMLYETGSDTKTIQSVVGHADYSTTMNTYVHARDDRKQAAMAHINDRITA